MNPGQATRDRLCGPVVRGSFAARVVTRASASLGCSSSTMACSCWFRSTTSSSQSDSAPGLAPGPCLLTDGITTGKRWEHTWIGNPNGNTNGN